VANRLCWDVVGEGANQSTRGRVRSPGKNFATILFLEMLSWQDPRLYQSAASATTLPPTGRRRALCEAEKGGTTGVLMWK
jgi:hypothetical protein